MDNYAWAIMIVWFFLLVIGRVWKENLFTVGGGIVGLVLMAEIAGDSFIFAAALFLINAYILWVAVTSEL